MEEALSNHYYQQGDTMKPLSSAGPAQGYEEENTLSPVNARLAALGQVASGIVHEISNPLATIKACAEGLLKRLYNQKVDVDLFKNYLEIIDEEVTRCSRISSSILKFVQDFKAEKQDVDIHAVIDTLIEGFSVQGRLNEIAIVKNYQEKILRIPGRECELNQICSSIIANGLDAMNGKGTLTLETGIDGDSAFVRISNTGTFLPPDQRSRIFEPFYTTKSKTGGTGLGLYIAKNIIKDNNGTIDLVSEEGGDTTFTITLPL